MHKLLYLLLVLVLFSDCKKKLLNTTIEGYVTDYYTGEPIAGAEVLLIESKIKCNEFRVIETQRVSAITNEIGYYKIKYKMFSGKRTDWIYASKDDEYFKAQADFPPDYDYCKDKQLKPGQKNRIDIRMKGKSTTVYHIKNITPFNQDDLFNWGNHLLEGMNVDTIIYNRNNLGPYTARLIWEVTKNNVTNTFEDSVFVPYKQTIYYEILY